jgi:hypothetical protein
MKNIAIILILTAFVACQKSENCDVDGVSTHFDYNTQICGDGTKVTAHIDTITTYHVSICDCETYCESLNRAFDNTIAIYEKQMATATGDELKKLREDRDYLKSTKPNCNCK